MRGKITLIFGTIASASSIDLSAYDVISRPRHLQTWGDEANISFDGNVAAIQALALEKAAALANTGDSNKSPLDEDLAMPNTCDGTLTQTVLSLRFEYSIEYDSSYDASQGSRRRAQTSNLDDIVQAFEIELQNRLSSTLLMCQADDREIQEASIVGLVRTPKDEALNDSKYFQVALHLGTESRSHGPFSIR